MDAVARAAGAVLNNLADIFRRNLTGDSQANMAPMRVKWKPRTQALMAKSRPYPPEKRQWLLQHIIASEKSGLEYSNLQAGFARVVVVVSKGSVCKLVTDYRAVSQQVEGVSWPHPNLEQAVENFAGATCFASVAPLRGFWKTAMGGGGLSCGGSAGGGGAVTAS